MGVYLVYPRGTTLDLAIRLLGAQVEKLHGNLDRMRPNMILASNVRARNLQRVCVSLIGRFDPMVVRKDHKPEGGWAQCGTHDPVQDPTPKHRQLASLAVVDWWLI